MKAKKEEKTYLTIKLGLEKHVNINQCFTLVKKCHKQSPLFNFLFVYIVRHN